MSAVAAQKPMIWDLYKEDDFIDAKDNQGDWRVGYIVAKIDHTKTFRVRFDGWSSKYDESYKHNSYKLLPFRSVVIGYTGQVQNPAVREDWKFVPTKHQERLSKLKELMAAPESFSVHHLNQTLRGHNYMYNDFLMTTKFRTIQQMSSAIQFFETNVVHLTQYLKTIEQSFNQYLAVISNQAEIEQWTSRQAYFRSYYEVFDTNYTIWGSYNRLQSFFRDNSDLIRGHFDEEGSKLDPKKMLQTQMTQQLLKLGCYQTINAIVHKLQQYQQIIPFLFLYSFTNLMTAVYSLIAHQQKEILIEKLIKIGNNNLNRLKDLHLKELHKHHVSSFLNALALLSPKTKFDATIIEWTTERELQLSLKLIVCPFFEKKLKGIAYMIEILQKNEFVLKDGFFKVWSQRISLYEILFVNSDNSQFVRKACELAKYLFIKNNLTEDNIDLILKSRAGKHETVLKQIYNLIAEFTLYESNHDQKMKLFTKISDMAEEDWDDDYIHMIREVSENSYGLNLRDKLIHPFGFEMVYRYAAKTESQFALGELLHILHRIEKSDVFNNFEQKCFQKIEEGEKIGVHLKILLMICNNRIDSFDKLEINLIKILVNCIAQHTEDEQSKIVQDGLELLTEVAKNTSRDIEVEQLGFLWNNTTNSRHKDCFLRWLFRKKDNGRVTLNTCLNQQHRRYLLESLWNTPEEIKIMNQAQTIFMIELFKSVNIVEHKMNRISIVIRPTSFDLIAYEKLWNILKETTNEKTVALLCDLLAEVHTCYQEEHLNESIENLVQNIAMGIKSAMEKQDIGYLTCLLQLTERLILRDEQIFNNSFSPRVNYSREYTIVNRQNSDTKVIKFNCMNIFYELKKVISQKFNIPLPKLIVYNSKQQQIKLESYFKTLNEVMVSSSKFEITEDLEYESVVKTSLNKKLDLFFELLDDHRIEKIVWSIVQKLPISDELKFKLVETENLLEELKSVGFYKQIYELKVVLQLPQEWWDRFVTTENLTQLIKGFSKINFKTHIELEYTATLSQIIGKMLEINEKQDKAIGIPEDLAVNIFEILRIFLGAIEKDGSKSIDLEIKIIRNLFDIIERLKFQLASSACLQLLGHKDCEQLIVTGLLRLPQLPLRKIFYERLRILFQVVEEPIVQGYLELLLLKILPLVVSLPDGKQNEEYFQFTSYFLSILNHKNIRQFQDGVGKDVCRKLLLLIDEEKPEVTSDSPNFHLIGYLSLLKYFVACQQPQFQQKIANFVIDKCLFAHGSSMCKSKPSRAESFALLRILFCYNSRILQTACHYITSLHKTGQWRTRRLDDWTINLMDKMKSSTGYVGIKNLGCICYMNSFMQQLFMIPRFRNAITTCEEPSFVPELKEQNLLYQVQKMFLNLWNSDKKFYNPKDFCNAFKDYQGNPTNVTEQMDIDEFSNVLFDRLENQMKETNRPTIVKDMFGGVFSNQIVCKGCPHYSETEEHFLSISLTVKNKKNIYQSFDTMIKGDNLDGDNAYYCQRCNKKVSAVKRVSLKKLPDYLIVTLKRFEFDYEKMIKLKVNDYCEFPQNLNLKQYSRQHLRRQQSTKEAEFQDQEMLSNDYFNYVLKGVVVHLGYADSGHYYSFIQDRSTGKWHEFNDTVVRPFNIDDIAEEAYGGETTGYESKEKIKNAYMLIYQRQKKLSNQKQSSIPKEQILQKEYNKPTLDQILIENKEQKIQNILFSHQYHIFVQELLECLPRLSQNQQKDVLKYVITVYLTITVRQKSEGSVYNMLKKIYAKVRAHNEIKQWMISLFSQRKIFDEFFKNCLIRQVKKTLAFWLVDMYDHCNRDSQELFLNCILTRMTEDNQNTLEPCLILYQISKKSPKTLDYLVSKGIVGRFIENIVRKDPRVFVEKLQVLSDMESQIGNQIVFQKSESQLLKKIKFDNENGYIWALINLIVARAKELNTPLDKYLTQIEVKYLRLSDPKIYKILEEIKNKFQMYQFLNYLCFLSFDNKELLLSLIKNVSQGLKDFQSKRYRQFFLLFERLINVQDDLKELRLTGFRSLQEGLICNEKYSLDSNIIMQWIIILINRNQNLRAHVQADRNGVNYLCKMATKRIPSDDVARKNVLVAYTQSVYGEFMINKLHGVKFPKSKKGYIKLTDDMTHFYERMLEDRFEQSQIWPSVPETESAELKVGDIVAYFDTKDRIEYEEAKVESIFLGRLELQLKKNRSVQVWKDDEKISLDVKFVHSQQENDLNSSQTTQMDVDDDEDYFDDL